MSELASVLTVDEVLSYLGIDYADEMATKNITRAINTADAFLKGSIGANYPVKDPRAKELALIIVSDLYDTRGFMASTSVSPNVRRLVEDMSAQLRLDLASSGAESESIDMEEWLELLRQKTEEILKSANEYSDQKNTETLENAKNYADQTAAEKVSEGITQSNNYTDEKLGESKDYTDTAIRQAINDSWEVPV